MNEKSDHRQYYEDELAYLRDLGEVFSRANPDVAGLLSRQSHDPDIERLFEAFAFLTARLRQRMDGGVPEFSHTLVSAFCPEYLRSIPSLTMMEFSPDLSGEVVVLPAETEILSRRGEGQPCRFRLCSTLSVLPARIDKVSWQEHGRSTVLALTVDVSAKGGLAALGGRSLPLFLGGGHDPRVGRLLLHALLTDTASVHFSAGAYETKLDNKISHIDLKNGGAFLPRSSGQLPAIQIMQEYLAFPTPFIAAILPEIPKHPDLEGNRCTITITFSRRVTLPAEPDVADFRLNCVPAINLFEEKGEPIRLVPNRWEYRLRPNQSANTNAQVYAVTAIRGIGPRMKEWVDFAPFGRFAHIQSGHCGRYYQTRLKPSVGGMGMDHWLSFINGQERLLHSDVDTITTSLLCTNGTRAALIPPGGLNSVGWAVKYTGSLQNIIPTTSEIQPPLNENMIWPLVSMLSGGMQSLDHVDALATLIDTLDFSAMRDSQALLRRNNRTAALRSIHTQTFDSIVRGFPVRGMRTVLDLDGACFSGRGDVYLFGLLLNTFFRLSKPVNAIWQFELRDVHDNSSILFPVCQGRGTV